ncbi:MAG: NifU family protein [Proteobacteria bacterium]|nr:NifU family protein [Pseudomonadota bacterium]NDC18393.1 NifU family protein [Pseudomonadota bacterium]
MNIDVQQTPNPDTLKFVLSLELVQNGSMEFKNSAEAKEYPFVQKIFQLGAELVFFGNNFISVKKNSGTQWNEISEKIQDIIKNDFPKDFKAIIVKKETSNNKDEIFKRIEEVLELKIRPAVAMDGGNISLRSFVDGVAEVELQGSCAGCPSSTLTLKQGVERMLVHYVPEVKSVRAVSL